MRHVLVPALLGIGALVAIAIATSILFLPGAFYASYGIDPGGNTALLNELKAPALLIMLAGLVILAGFFRPPWRQRALWAGAVFYLTFGLSRLVSIAIDGVPPTGLLWAMASEFGLGLLFAFALWRARPAD